ncbi:MAG: hypothetical protein H7338_01510 [Candidatus Sericytochromatia bacterium]|nr:hypothetical protein [Candidatus Sericytochromatia bacterium]
MMGLSGTPAVSDPVLDDDGDLWLARAYNFRIHEKRYTLFKVKGEPYRHVLLRAVAVFLYAPVYDTLTIDTPLFRNKYKADVAAFDYANDPLFWAECGETAADTLEFIVKHTGARDIAWIDSTPIGQMEAFARKAMHFKYLDKMTLVSVPDDALQYVDPDHFWLDERDLTRFFF